MPKIEVKTMSQKQILSNKMDISLGSDSQIQIDDVDELDEEGFPKAMPKLVPFEGKTLWQKPLSNKMDIGLDDKPKLQIKYADDAELDEGFIQRKKSVQRRLEPDYENPAIIERDRIAAHALRTYAANLDELLLGQFNQRPFKRSVQRRLEADWQYENPAVIERNRITIHALYAYAKNAAMLQNVFTCQSLSRCTMTRIPELDEPAICDLLED